MVEMTIMRINWRLETEGEHSTAESTQDYKTERGYNLKQETGETQLSK